METIAPTKMIYQKEAGFLLVGLSEEEDSELQTTLRELHKKQMTECIKDAIDVLEDYVDRPATSWVLRIAVAFFERRSQYLYPGSAYQEALVKKVHLIKNGNNRNGQ